MITVVGSYNVDLIIRVEKFPQASETVFTEGVKVYHGGKGSNQAVSASRLNGRVTLIAAVGNDNYGEEAIKFWQEEKVDTSYVKVKRGRTGMAYILVNRKGENMIVVDRGANSMLTSSDLDGTLGKVTLIQLEVNMDVVKTALTKSHGVKILNPAPVVSEVRSLLEMVDVLTPNEIEFMELTGTNDLSYGTLVLLKRVNKAVIVTLGEKGAFLATRNRAFRIPSPKVKPVDTTGAGDVFNAALAVALHEEMDLEDAVSFANKVASVSVMTEGALGPTIEEVRKHFEV
ncbi:ribokinase [Sulfolobales archaeon HS-7]|nr:ribokinase [Sulfolobales archaeon HS-7]